MVGIRTFCLCFLDARAHIKVSEIHQDDTESLLQQEAELDKANLLFVVACVEHISADIFYVGPANICGRGRERKILTQG